MQSQKAENLLNLALETPLEERLKSDNLNTGFSVTDRTWELIVKYNGTLAGLKEAYPAVTAEELIAGYGILTVPEGLAEQVIARPEIEYVEIPKKLYFADIRARAASCILPVTDRSPFLTGRGVIVAVIDSGIDYRLSNFRKEDGSTRILALWDQGQSLSEAYPPPQGFFQGRLYTEADINAALETGRLTVPLSEDTSGHGTGVAGMAASGFVAENGYQGVAPEADLMVVKLGNVDRTSYPRTTELMRALTFTVKFAQSRSQPVAINLSFGNTYGPHDGTSLLERFIDNISEIGRNAVCIGSGNEGAAGGRTEIQLQEGRAAEIELGVANYEATLNVQLYKSYQDVYRITVTAPDGASVILPLIENGSVFSMQATLDRTRLLIYLGEPKPYTTDQEIYMDFLPLDTYVASGVWTFRIEPIEVLNGYVSMYLPSYSVRNSGTRFFNATPEGTLTIPSTASKAISVGAYNAELNSYGDFSGRGFQMLEATGKREPGRVRPTLSAPGVNVTVPAPGLGNLVTVSGTSFSTPIVTGSAALMMEWGIIRGNDPYLYGEKIKASLIRGARRLPANVSWPNPQFGWGALCLADSLPI